MKTKAPSMADLMSAWQEAKAEESAANAKRLEIEKLMVEKGIADHETAADYFVWKKQAEDTVARAQAAAMPKQLVSPFKDFFASPIQKAREEAFKVLGENRRPARPAGL